MGGLGRKFLHKLPDIEILRNLESPFVLWIQIDTCFLASTNYDWAHLAMNYWPERVREKCKTDKSLAIAHGLEELYIEPEAKPKKVRGKRKAGGDV